MLRNHLHQEQNKSKDLQQKLDKANLEITRLNLLELNNGRNALMRYRHLRETHSASTNLHYGGGDPTQTMQHLKVSSCSSFYSKSPLCDSYRNEVLYEDQVAEEVSPDSDFNEKLIKFEQQKKLHLQRTKALNYTTQEEDDDQPKPQPKEDIDEPHNEEPEAEEPVIEKVVAYTCETEIVEKDLIDQFKSLNREDIFQKESVLDQVCASLTKTHSLDSSSSSNSSPKMKKPVLKSSLSLGDRTSSKKAPIDPKNKTKLLAALKAIDANESFDS